MQTLIVILVLFGGVALWLVWKSFSRNAIKDPNPFVPPTDANVLDPNPIEPGEIIVPGDSIPEVPLDDPKEEPKEEPKEIVNPKELVLPIDVSELPVETPKEVIPAEMPDKPLPINCQLAQFQPVPQDFFYIDCCGKPHKGEGFQPWEKRAPVAIDSNKEFFGMTLLDVEAERDC